ncbi:hypothetical protein RF11_02176 [Thelohanellus kitauei]|uniref:Uncharacterized protein n=1 Tax=Thelohanellus kitauei TaxID=669202 RepID=A0A0C2IFR2_THEKT|nr:hypothetical protein RF11_02176 [Thelohanellus kitauei]
MSGRLAVSAINPAAMTKASVCEQHRNYDRRQDQCGSVIGKQCSNSSPKQDYPAKQKAATSVTPAGDVQCGPFKEAGLIEQQADDDDRNKCRCRVPDDIPDNGNISASQYSGLRVARSPVSTSVKIYSPPKASQTPLYMIIRRCRLIYPAIYTNPPAYTARTS